MLSEDLIARTVAFKPGERNVFLHLLTQCNLSCRHCYINPDQHGTSMLPKETVLHWLRLFARPERESNLILLGGEPTLHPHLALIIKAAKAMRYAVTVDSNGFLFHDLLKRVRPDELDFLSFSLDGPSAAINDPIRGEGVFEVCTDNLRRAVALGFRTSLICTVSALNIDHLHQMPALLCELGVRRFFIQVIGLRGNSAAANSLQVAPEHWREVVPEAARQAAQLGIHVTYPKVFLEPEEAFSCAGQVAQNYFVFPNGRVYQCPLCEDYPFHSFYIENDQLLQRPGITEERFFRLNIPEGCVMSNLLQSGDDLPHETQYRISCCMLKQEILPFLCSAI
jgi:MoaA/NifB/PqqE/SkfB family radical SAM enzyme